MSRLSNFLDVPAQNLQRSRSLSPSLKRSNPGLTIPLSDQCLYRHVEMGTWRPILLPLSPSGIQTTWQVIPNVQITTWNIDFSSPLVYERTNGILDYIEDNILGSKANTLGIPTILLFQEVHASAFRAFLNHPFIQKNYDLTDVSTRHFRARYGTLTCVPHTLTPFVTFINRIPFGTTRMGRDMLTIDLDLPHLPCFRRSFPFQPILSRIRICNTHLESLRGHADLARPEQLREISQLLFSANGGVVAGDMNAIAPTDHQVPSSLGLVDIWELMHPQAPPIAGHTWGYQPRSRRYQPRRLDKVLFSGGLTPVSIERFGVGLYIQNKWSDVWLSDHYGLIAQFTIG